MRDVHAGDIVAVFEVEEDGSIDQRLSNSTRTVQAWMSQHLPLHDRPFAYWGQDMSHILSSLGSYNTKDAVFNRLGTGL